MLVQFLDDLVFESHENARAQDGHSGGRTPGSLASGFFLFSIVSLMLSGCVVIAAFVVELAIERAGSTNSEHAVSLFFPWLFVVFAMPAYYIVLGRPSGIAVQYEGKPGKAARQRAQARFRLVAAAAPACLMVLALVTAALSG